MNYQKKYLKYKNKYLELQSNSKYLNLFSRIENDKIILNTENKNKFLNLRKQIDNLNIQKGGYKFQVISNNGGVSENGINMGNQCMWISIRDYLRYFKNIHTTVTELKTIARLNIDATKYEQFDLDSRKFNFKDGIDFVAKHHNLRIEAFLIDSYGNSHPHLVDDFGMPIPMHIVNETGKNLVKIAFYGGHFELIVDGYTQPPPHIKPVATQPYIYNKTENLYIKPDLSDESDIMQILLIDLNNLLEILKMNEKFIQNNTDSIIYFNQQIKTNQAEIMMNLKSQEMNVELGEQKEEYHKFLKSNMINLSEENNEHKMRILSLHEDNKKIIEKNKIIMDQIKSVQLIISEKIH
jgi:hypothetical protein